MANKNTVDSHKKNTIDFSIVASLVRYVPNKDVHDDRVSKSACTARLLTGILCNIFKPGGAVQGKFSRLLF